MWINNPSVPSVTPETVQKLAQYPTSVLADAIGKLNDERNNVIGNGLKAVKPGLKVAGLALTVKATNGNSFPVHYAIYNAFPGAVICVDTEQYTQGPYLGDLMIRTAQGLGVAGMLIDGYYRDWAEIAAMDFPLFARGCHPRKPSKAMEGEINTPVYIDGVKVYPGDVIIGDDDGFVIICPECAEQLVGLAEEKNTADVQRAEKIETFFSLPPEARNLQTIMGGDFMKALAAVENK